MKDLERVAWILLDAFAIGDIPAARKWNISRRTVDRYRARMRSEPELAKLVSEKRSGAETELSALRVRFLRKAIAKLEQRIESDDVSVHEMAGAVKIVGELHQVSEALNDERSDEPDPDAAEDARDSADQSAATH